MAASDSSAVPTPPRPPDPIMVAWERIDEATGRAIARLERTSSGWLAHGQEVVTGGDVRRHLSDAEVEAVSGVPLGLQRG